MSVRLENQVRKQAAQIAQLAKRVEELDQKLEAVLRANPHRRPRPPMPVPPLAKALRDLGYLMPPLDAA